MKGARWVLLPIELGVVRKMESVILCSQDKTIKVWHIEQGVSTKPLDVHTLAVYCLLLLCNENLASGSKTTQLKFGNLNRVLVSLI
jgi:hypothetical protein